MAGKSFTDEELLASIKRGQVDERLKSLSPLDPRLKLRKEDGRTLIAYAFQSGVEVHHILAVVNVLVDKGASVNDAIDIEVEVSGSSV